MENTNRSKLLRRNICTDFLKFKVIGCFFNEIALSGTPQFSHPKQYGIENVYDMIRGLAADQFILIQCRKIEISQEYQCTV